MVVATRAGQSTHRSAWRKYDRHNSIRRIASAKQSHFQLQSRHSLQAYESQLSSVIVYLHDIRLNRTSIAQNHIIMAFAIAAMLFLAPTLMGTIFGMPF